jgi:hypothetical protein
MNWCLVAFMITIHMSCLGLLLLSCYPGGIYEYLGYFLMLLFVSFYTSSLLVPIFILLIGGGIIWRQSRRRQQFQRINVSPPTRAQAYFQQFGIITGRLLLITFLLVHNSLLQKAVFALSVPVFTTDSAKLAQNCQDKKLGFYRIIDCYDDSQGGWYFQTGKSFFHTYGFAYQPQPNWNRGLPKQFFTYYPMIGKWKSFEERHEWN